MKKYSLKSVFHTAVLSAVAFAANIAGIPSAMSDVNVGALACQPPFLDQAASVRWHEHYLIAPTTGSQQVWVVCPISFETKDLPDQFFIGAFGNSVNAGTSALCYANVVDIRNQHIPVLNFLDNPGQNMVFSTIMQTQNPANTLWSSWVMLSKDQIIARMMDPPSTPISQGQSVGSAYWTITVNCRLNPGQAINMVSLFPTL